MKLVLLTIASISALMNSSCNYNYLKNPNNLQYDKTANGIESMDYKSVHQKVIHNHCNGCHSNSGGNQGGVNLESYEALRAVLPRIYVRSIEKRDMPPNGGLSASEYNLLKRWIEEGAPEYEVDLGESKSKELESVEVTFDNLKTYVFEMKCASCHRSPNPDAGLDLAKYESVRSRATQIFERVIVKQDMPIQPIPALTMSERKFLLKWFNLGMPD